jgi:hypothetical protein
MLETEIEAVQDLEEMLENIEYHKEHRTSPKRRK